MKVTASSRQRVDPSQTYGQPAAAKYLAFLTEQEALGKRAWGSRVSVSHQASVLPQSSSAAWHYGDQSQHRTSGEGREDRRGGRATGGQSGCVRETGKSEKSPRSEKSGPGIGTTPGQGHVALDEGPLPARAHARASPASRLRRQAQCPARHGAPASLPASREAAGSRASSGEKQPPTGRAAEGRGGGAQEPGAPCGGHSRGSGNNRMRRRPHCCGRERLPERGRAAARAPDTGGSLRGSCGAEGRGLPLRARTDGSTRPPRDL